MKDSQVLNILKEIKDNNVYWMILGSRVQFLGPRGDSWYTKPPKNIEKLSEHYYSREGFEDGNEGKVSLTMAGEQLLSELESERKA